MISTYLLPANQSLPARKRGISQRTLDKLIPTKNVGTGWKWPSTISPRDSTPRMI